MNISWLTFLVLALRLSDQILITAGEESDEHFVNEWAAKIPGGWHQAKRVAEEYGYKIIREVKGIPDHYALKRSDVPHRSRRSAHHHTRMLSEDARVMFVEQQQEKIRTKRSMASREVVQDIVKHGGQLDDPRYAEEWYLNKAESGTDRRNSVNEDLKVKEVWRKGITGRNVVVTVVDDGLETNHTDLAENYDPDASFDLNGNDTDPFPRYDPTNENKHGTRCAGEVAMLANNEICGAGIAFDAKIGGIRLLDGTVTDRLEGDAFSFNKNHIGIYSVSWGPSDNGKTLEGPSYMAALALTLGISEGRQGKGSIYVWASGNGGGKGDNCNCDGYAASRLTIAVSSVEKNGDKPWFAEECASTLTTTYSSGSAHGGVVTSDLHNRCTSAHTGTSASAPMAAGIIALLLEQNPELTWRDVQHIIVHTSNPYAMANDGGWYKNGAGYCVNLAFGFGLMNALAMVELADPKIWKHVPELHKCVVEPMANGSFPQNFKSGEFVEVEFQTDGCKGQANEINFLEHAELVINAKFYERGNMYAEVTSPMGTTTILMIERSQDKSNDTIVQWPLVTVHSWGENPQGIWKFRIADRSKDSHNNQLGNVTLQMYGTKNKPAYLTDNPVDCKLVDARKREHPVPNPRDLDAQLKRKLVKAVAQMKLDSQYEKEEREELEDNFYSIKDPWYSLLYDMN